MNDLPVCVGVVRSIENVVGVCQSQEAKASRQLVREEGRSRSSEVAGGRTDSRSWWALLQELDTLFGSAGRLRQRTVHTT